MAADNWSEAGIEVYAFELLGDDAPVWIAVVHSAVRARQMGREFSRRMPWGSVVLRWLANDSWSWYVAGKAREPRILIRQFGILPMQAELDPSWSAALEWMFAARRAIVGDEGASDAGLYAAGHGATGTQDDHR